MRALNASVLWCGVTGAVLDASRPESTSSSVSEKFHDCIDDATCLPLLAQQGREFGCNGCNIIELIISGSYRMAPDSSKRWLQWTEHDVPFNVHEYASRRGIMGCNSKRTTRCFCRSGNGAACLTANSGLNGGFLRRLMADCCYCPSSTVHNPIFPLSIQPLK